MSISKNLLQMNAGHKSYGLQQLFDAATFSVNEGEHVGVIGPNGAGKSTLFKILIQEEELDSGQLIRSKDLRIGYLSQHDHWSPEETGNDYLNKVCKIPIWQAKSAGSELQIAEEIYSLPIMSLSGGYRMRIKLVGLLGMDPNLMLLDEPTNYLDLETTLLLERFLQNYEGAFLLISHDREVLRRTTDHILEVEGGEIIKYSGNIDDYFEQKELIRTQLAAQAQNQALKRKAIMEFVTRFGAKATKAKQAQSKLKTLQKMETIELKEIPVRAAIRIPKPSHVGRHIIKLNNAKLGYEKKVVIKNVNLEINRGDHVAVVGFNGAGKSTLLKSLAGGMDLLSGQRELGYQVSLAIFNQHVVEILNPEHTVYESMEEVTATDITPQDIRDMAGSLLFNSHHISKKIKVLSGGEKSRVALGRILLQRVPCLMLDEPTNHLDFETVEALTQALTAFTGTLIVVSHDRGFIRRVGTKILEVANQEVSVYPGTYDEYVWSLQQRLANPAHSDSSVASQKSSNTTYDKKTPSDSIKPDKKQNAKHTRSLDKQIENCLNQIEKLETEIAQLNERIASTNLLKGSEAQEAIQLLSERSLQLQQLEEKWSDLICEKEKIY